VVDPHRIQQAIADVRDQASFIQRLLIDTLGWPVDQHAQCVDDIAYEWTAGELRADDLDRHVVDNRICQLQPPADPPMPWGVFIVEFNSPDAFTTGRGMTGPLRRILRGLVPKARGRPSHLPAWDRENLLFICTHNFEHFRFAYFKAPSEGTKTAPLVTFGWSPGVPARTVCEFNLGRLEWPERGIAECDWVARWATAFDVEKVTREFYRDYDRVFHKVEALIRDHGDHDLDTAEDLRMFTQSLFNRLMFLRFVERKGWLIYQGRTEYLRALHAAGGIGGNSLYQSRIRPLFFEGLAVEGIDKQEVFGNTVFLNGGLFEKGDLDAKVRDVPDEVFDRIIGADGLFYHYNFTVEESTPLDIEVAVDPEMLGKVFEELVTGRHETGSYYTPRQVVSFMCREALKGYLGDKTGAGHDTIASLVDKHEVEALSVTHARQVLQALDALKAVDPACGSGAYLLGLLHEMAAIYRLLYSEKLTQDARSLFRLKQQIICNNLYGVDIDPFATSIAMLRLWLSLIVEFDEFQPPPLPNLDFKIETGDSLLGPDPQEMPDLFREQMRTQADVLVELKEKYLEAHGEEKERLRETIRREEAAIAERLHERLGAGVIDWRIHFAEVFVRSGGFNVVLANPPYVRADAQFRHIEDENARQENIAEWKDYRGKLKTSGIFKTLYEKWDLYVPFLERAWQLLADGGRMVFIISDAYNAAKYAKKSHEFFVENARVERVDFCSEIDLFDAGINNTIVIFARAAPEPDHEPVRVRRWGSRRDDFDQNAEVLPTGPQSKLGPALFRLGQEMSTEESRGLISLGKIFYVSVGMVIHCDEKKAQGLFKAEDLISPKKDALHPKPYVEGKDIMRWHVSRIRYLEYGTERAPGMFRRPTFPELHEAPERLLASRMCGSRPAIAYDARQVLSNHTVIVFTPWHGLQGVRNASISRTAKYHPGGDREQRELLSKQINLKYIMAVMHSRYASAYLNRKRRHKLDIYPDDWKELPIPPAPPKQQATLAALAQKCLDAKGEGCEKWEEEIDRRVQELVEIDWTKRDDAIRMPPPPDASKPSAGNAAGRKGKPPEFELRPDTRTVTGRLDLGRGKAGARTQRAKRPTAGKSKSGSLSINDFDRDRLKDALLDVVGTDWIKRDDAIREAARSLGFRRCGKRIHKAFASAITGLLRQNRLESTGSQIRSRGDA